MQWALRNKYPNGEASTQFWGNDKPSAFEAQRLYTPAAFRLYQNNPNPFNPTTTINDDLQITNYIDLSVYNLLGQKVATLVSKNRMPANIK